MKNLLISKKKTLVENGYCVIDKFIDNQILQNAQKSFFSIKKKVKLGHYPYYRIYDDCAFNKNISGIEMTFNEKILTQPIIDFISSCKVLEYAKELLGDNIELELSRFHLTESFSHVGNWHRDEKINHENQSIQINIFLFDEKGLQVIDKSHKYYDSEEEKIKKTPHASLKNSKWINTKAGDILIFDPAVLHRGISVNERANIHFRFRKINKIINKTMNLNYQNLNIQNEWITVLKNSSKSIDEQSLKPFNFKKDLKSSFYRLIRKLIHNFVFFLPLHSKIYYFFNIWPNLKLRKIFNLKT